LVPQLTLSSFPYSTLFRSNLSLAFFSECSDKSAFSIVEDAKESIVERERSPKHGYQYRCDRGDSHSHGCQRCMNVLGLVSEGLGDRKSTRLNSSHVKISYA